MKVCLVTGSSKGIGRAIAIRMAQAGYTVVINYSHSEKPAQETLDLIKANGGDGMIIKADVSKLEEVKAMVKEVFNTYKQIDVLVNNAGIARDEFLLAMNPENLDKCLDLNIKGYFYCAQQVGLKMFRKKKGVIINISSVSGKISIPGQTVYSATKGAVNQFTKTLAKEMGPYGIRVNAIAPGFIETEMMDEIPEDLKAGYLKEIPVGRFGKVEDVANLCEMLTRGEMSYLTGEVITLDGGLSL